MTSIPWELFTDLCDPKANPNADGSSSCAVGMIFLPKEENLQIAALRSVEKSIRDNGMEVAGWRDVPVDENVLGSLSRDFVPTIRQVNFCVHYLFHDGLVYVFSLKHVDRIVYMKPVYIL